VHRRQRLKVDKTSKTLLNQELIAPVFVGLYANLMPFLRYLADKISCESSIFNAFAARPTLFLYDI
jgi:hypothetical protein